MGLFSRLRTKAQKDAELTLDELTIPISNIDLSEVLTPWRWLVSETHKPIMLSAIGDLFFEAPEGSIYWLNVGKGKFVQVAGSRVEFEKFLSTPEIRAELLSPVLVSELRAAKKYLKTHQCYSYKVPPFLGGATEPSNLEPVDIFVHLDIIGQILQQVKDLPAGTKIKGFGLKQP